MNKSVKLKLDKLWSKAVKVRAGYKCERNPSHKSDTTKSLNSHHLFTRSAMSTRWSMMNGICLCVGCHRYAHREPLDFHEWVKGYKGEDWYNALRRMKHTPNKPDPAIIEIMLNNEIYECE